MKHFIYFKQKYGKPRAGAVVLNMPHAGALQSFVSCDPSDLPQQ